MPGGSAAGARGALPKSRARNPVRNVKTALSRREWLRERPRVKQASHTEPQGKSRGTAETQPKELGRKGSAQTQSREPGSKGNAQTQQPAEKGGKR
jgi:hypothetical protein